MAKKHSIVGYGPWPHNNDNIIKGYVKGPVKKLRYELAKHCRVIDVDEYKSSKLCHIRPGSYKLLLKTEMEQV